MSNKALLNKIVDFLYKTLEEPESNNISYWINLCIYILIILSIVVLMLSSVTSIYDENIKYFNSITHIIMPLFVLEYILRLVASGKLEKYRGIRGKIRYIFSPYSIVDLFAIAPYLIVAFGMDSAFIRSLRLLRIFRLLRVKKYAKFVDTLRNIFSTKKEEFLVLLFFTLITILILSFIVYELEHEAQPESFSNIFQTLWWAVATLTTVGYGDIYPVTVSGKFVTAIISILGIALIAIPGGMLASEFINSISKEKEQEQNINTCPACQSLEIELPNEKNQNTFKKCNTCGLHWYINKEKNLL